MLIRHWSLHNLVAHPLSELLHLTGVALEWAGGELRRMSVRVHDETIPAAAPATENEDEQ